jgi:hypothetical protein
VLSDAFDILMRLHHDAGMRTTIDLPDDLHRIIISLSTHTRRSLSATAAELLRRGLEQGGVSSHDAAGRRLRLNSVTGLPLVALGRPVTTEDVKSLEDEA